MTTRTSGNLHVLISTGLRNTGRPAAAVALGLGLGLGLLALSAVLPAGIGVAGPPAQPDWLSPAALVASPDGKSLYVACTTANRVLQVDPAAGKVVRSIEVSNSPTGLALSRDGATLYVTCASAESRIDVVDLSAGRVRSSLAAGHTATGPVLSPDGKTLYVCQRFDGTVAAFDLAGAGKGAGEPVRIPVGREPISAAVTPDGKTLLVAHHLHDGPADANVVSAGVSVIDLATRKVTSTLALPNGSGLLRDVRIAPGGQLACVAHNLARFQLPTTQVDRGWMNTSALTLIDMTKPAVINTVLLDNVDRGAANPWAVAWSDDGQTLCVSHAGTQEVSVIDVAGLLAKLAKLPLTADPTKRYGADVASRIADDVPNDLSFLVGLRQRIALTGNGPRALAFAGPTLFAANYFSDALDRIDLKAPVVSAATVRLGPEPRLTPQRRGEIAFNDASICFQGWQSCSSCHSEDARSDGMNWDLLNDGIGNPKNSRSLVFSHETPPAMSTGVRETAETAVRAGIQHILFTVQPEQVASDLDAWLKSLRPVPSPHLVGGQLSPAARRGEAIFRSKETGCASCHAGPKFTDLKHHNTGTRGKYDKDGERYDTPTLLEGWRTGPYLHDGSAATPRDVLTTRNPTGRHGQTSHLSAEQLDDLVAYLLSL
jgi:YVTN family beta-propeller protein